MSNTILNTKKLSIGYKHALIENIELSVKAGEIIALIGSNGCGKTTLLKTLSGLLKPIKGIIEINNLNISSIKGNELAKLISIVLTDVLLPYNMTITSLISMGRYPHNDWFGNLAKEDIDKITYAINVTGLNDYKNKIIAEVSDGTKQKAMIARALSQDTPLIFLDEPTAYLDIPSKLEIMQILKTLAHEHDKSVMLSTHDLELAIQNCDKIWLIDKFNNIDTGAPEDLIINGYFEKMFNNDNVRFEKENGRFKLNYGGKKSICVKGNTYISYWTERALERVGYVIDNNNDTDTIIIETENKVKWLYNYKDKLNEFHSIESLIQFMRRI